MFKNILKGFFAVLLVAGLVWATEYPPSSTFDGIVTNSGIFVVQEDGAALTALQLLDNAISGAGFNITQLGGTNILSGGVAGSLGIGGLSATGAAVTGNPIFIALVDGSGNVRQITGSTAGVASLGTATTADDVRSNSLTLSVDQAGTSRLFGTAPFWYDGTSAWVRPRGSITDGLLVNLGTNNDVVASAAVGAPLAVRLSDGVAFIDNIIFGTATYLESTTIGAMIAVVRNDDLSPLADVDNELAPLQVNALGALYTGKTPISEVAVLLMIDGSADTDIVTTNLSKSSALAVTGSGTIEKVCLIVEGTSPFSEDGTLYFFDADPVIISNTADMTVAEADTVVAMVSFTGGDYNDNFATVKMNCQNVDERYHAITHVVYEQEGATTIANQDFRLHVWHRRDT